MALSAAADISIAISDLEARLLHIKEGHRVLTSDNPVFFYNQFCEKVRGLGVRGAASTGLQVFLPLNSETSLLMYDKDVYTLGRHERTIHIPIENSDVDWLNKIQMLNCSKNVYFREGYTVSKLRSYLAGVASLRDIPKTKIQKADGAHPQESSVLIHTYRPQPNLKLHLSFIKVNQEAKKTPVSERGSRYRETSHLIRDSDKYDRPNRKTTTWKARK